MPLSLRDQLALAMTSAGSQRALAALVGVTHQKIGRWLREGEPGGAKRIPPEAAGAIRQAFDIHKQLARAQARADGMPYDPRFPVFINRPQLKDGRPGERVYIDQTQYLGTQLRQMVIGSLQQSRQFLQASVRSTIDLYSYIKAKPTESMPSLDRKIRQDSLASGFMAREEQERGSNRAAPLFTQYENISPGTQLRLSLLGIESKLRQKHEPHTGAAHPGTKLADQILLQTLPTPTYAKKTPTPKRGLKRR